MSMVTSVATSSVVEGVTYFGTGVRATDVVAENVDGVCRDHANPVPRPTVISTRIHSACLRTNAVWSDHRGSPAGVVTSAMRAPVPASRRASRRGC